MRLQNGFFGKKNTAVSLPVGFFDKDDEAEAKLDDGWQKRTHEKFRESYAESLVLFYINHLDLELGSPDSVFTG